MKKVKYNYNKSGAKKWQREATTKQDLLNKLIKLASRKVDVDMEQFVINPYAEYQKAIIHKYGNESFSHLGFDKLCQLLNIEERERIESLSAKYGKIKIELDTATFKAKSPNFWLYATTEQEIDNLNYAMQFVELWQEHKKKFPRANSLKFVQGLPHILIADWSDLNTVKVNPNFVRGGRAILH